MTDAPGPGLGAAGAALARGDWAAAREHFLRALSAEETPEALQGLAQAEWFLYDLESSLRHNERAYLLYRQRLDPRGAAIACWVALEHAGMRGDASVARGWFARAGGRCRAAPPAAPRCGRALCPERPGGAGGPG